MSGAPIMPGDLYRDKAGAIWRVVGRHDRPSVIIDRVLAEGGEPCAVERLHIGIDSLIFRDMARLVPEKQP